MANNYQFLDAYSSVQTAASSVVSGAHEPYVQISSFLVSVPASIIGTVPITMASSLTASILGSVPVTQSGTWAVSVVGASFKAEDTTHANADVGMFTLGVRNDAVASFTSANLDYGPLATDSAGRLIIKPYAATEALIQGTGSTMGISRSSLLALAGTGLRNYITDILIANTSSVATLVSFSDSDASIIGKTIAPAGSGSNIRLGTPMRTGALNSQVEFIAQTGASVLHVTAFGYKGP